MSLESFIHNIPKAELHLHIEGTLEPELLFALAKRNGIALPYHSVEQLRHAYNFSNLQDFLDIYYEGASVLLHEQDFYDLTWGYFLKAKGDNIRHAEIFFDPQTHTLRGVPFASVIQGIARAMQDAETKFGISSKLILCFLRHLDEESAMKTLQEALPYKNMFVAVGLDSSEIGNPPSKFAAVYDRARKEGLLTVAHAGEEGPAAYVREALELLHVSRIDHGNHAIDDAEVVRMLLRNNTPLTVCPLSNLKLAVVQDLKEHPLRTMIDSGLLVTLNSDDPAYFGGYLADNYMAIAKALDLSQDDIRLLATNSFRASFLDEASKERLIAEVQSVSAISS